MQFDVTIQGHFYKVMEGNNIGEVLKEITQDMINNKIVELIPSFDINKNHDVNIVPKENVS